MLYDDRTRTTRVWEAGGSCFSLKHFFKDSLCTQKSRVWVNREGVFRRSLEVRVSLCGLGIFLDFGDLKSKKKNKVFS